MFAKDFISEGILTITTSTTAAEALVIMEEQKVWHIPIVNNLDFLGLIAENDILSQNTLRESVGSHHLSLSHAFVNSNQHLFEVIALAATHQLSVVPVVDNKNRYLGSISLAKILQNYALHSSLVNPGGIILLECNENDYSLEAIARIVESNDSKILHCSVKSHHDSTKLEVSLKVNKMNIYPIIQTFERYGYQIIASFVEADYKEDIQNRYDMLMNYLNI